MTFYKKAEIFRILRMSSPVLGLGLCLFLLLIVVLSPNDPLDGKRGKVIDKEYWAEEKWISKQIKVYSVLKPHRKNLGRISTWTIAKTIMEESDKHSLDPMLVLAIIKVESRFRHLAVSNRGARGLMQIRPFVGRALAPQVDLNMWHGIKTLDDPILNIKIGVFYLSRLKKRFRDLNLALTAYNWGPTAIRNRLNGKRRVPLGYARKVLAAYHIYSHHHNP